ERSWLLEREASLRIVELHGRDTEVGENHVGARESLRGEHLRQAREVAAMGPEAVLEKPGRAQAVDRAREFDGIDVDPDHQAARLNTGQQRPGMSSETKRAIDRDFPGPWGKHGQHLVDHDRAVHARWGLAGVDDFPD